MKRILITSGPMFDSWRTPTYLLSTVEYIPVVQV